MANIQKQPLSLPKILWGFLVLFLISVTVAFGIPWLLKNKIQADRELPVYGTVPDFTMTKHTGDAFGLKDLKGKIWVADLIFTNCAGTCPVMTSNMAKLQAALPKNLDVKLVSISVDPKRDTSEILAQYANIYGAEKERWFFLTGSYGEIIRLANKGFHLSAGQLPPEDSTETDLGPITHSIKFVLIDPQGQIRGYYDGTEEASIKALIRDIKILNKKDTT